jgi:hypothetical protein
MKPKSETMWMAWHPNMKFIIHSLSTTKEKCEDARRLYSPEVQEVIEILKVQITEIPKKRGKG